MQIKEINILTFQFRCSLTHDTLQSKLKLIEFNLEKFCSAARGFITHFLNTVGLKRINLQHSSIVTSPHISTLDKVQAAILARIYTTNSVGCDVSPAVLFMIEIFTHNAINL